MSPYETRFIDVKFKDKIYGTLTVAVEEGEEHLFDIFSIFFPYYV